MSFKTIAVVTSTESKVRLSDGKTLLIQKDGKKGEKSFSFDAAYGPQSLTDFYQLNVKKTVESALNGESASILLLGSSNSDKANVYGSTDNSDGIVGFASKDIFSKARSLTITASMIQISGEDDLLDLLNPHTREMKVEKHKNISIAVKGLSELLCGSTEDLNKLYQEGFKASIALKAFQSTTVFTICIYKNTGGNNQFNGPLSKLHFFNLCGHDQVPEKAGLKAVLGALTKGKQIKNTNLSYLVQHGFTGCSSTILVPVVSSNEDIREMLQTMELTKSLSSIKPRPHKVADIGTVISSLRLDVNKLRERVSMQRPPKESDLSEMELMISELNAAKAMDLLKANNLSIQYHEERRNHYSHKGLLWILEGAKSSNHEKIKRLKTKLDECIADFKEKKKNRDKIKSNLQTEIDSYSKQVQDGTTNEKLTKDKVAKIHSLKDDVKVQDEKVKESKRNMKEAQELLRKEKDINMDFSSWSFDMMSRRLREDVDRLKKENKQIVDEEVEKMKNEIESEKADLNIREKSGELSSPSTDEFISTATQLFTLQAEKNAMTTQLDVLKRENSLMLEHFDKLTEKHKKEAEIKQLQNMQTFRAYREVFEEFKVDLENRWRGLLDESIQDAVFLNARNSELSDENKRLKEELHKLKQA